MPYCMTCVRRCPNRGKMVSVSPSVCARKNSKKPVKRDIFLNKIR